VPVEELPRLIKGLEQQMDLAARNLEFEKATLLRDQISELRKKMPKDKPKPTFNPRRGLKQKPKKFGR